MYANKSIEKSNSIIAFVVYSEWGYHVRDPHEMAKNMSTGDFFDLFAACGGDFSRLENNTREAMNIKGMELNNNYKERAARQTLYRKERAEKRHNDIIAEVRELMEGKENFTVVEVQLAAVNRGNGFPVRTRQMYTYHLDQEYGQTIGLDFSDTSGFINVILRDGRKSQQRIPGTKRRAYKFTK